MFALKIVLLLGFFYQFGACDNKVSDDLGPHMLLRIIKHLSAEQCEEFLSKINKEYGIVRKRREIADKDQCSDILVRFLKEQGDTLYWDLFADTLYDVTRDDVSQDMGKTMNQDKTKVMEYTGGGNPEPKKSLKSIVIPTGEKPEKHGARGKRVNKRDLNSLEEEDLIIEREQRPPYSRPLTAWCHPLIYGIIFGFSGSVLLAAALILVIVYITNQENSEIDISVQLFKDKLECNRPSEDSDDGWRDEEENSVLSSV